MYLLGGAAKGTMQVILGTRDSFFRGRFIRLFLLGILLVAGLRGMAQSLVPQDDSVDEARADLPDAPLPQNQETEAAKPLVAVEPKIVPPNTAMPTAPMFSRVIPAGMA